MEASNNALYVADMITNNEALSDVFMRTQNSVRNRLEKGERFSVCDMLAFPELFELRIKANRKAIDLLGINPTTIEMNDALEICGETMLENIEAYEGVTDPYFYD